MFSRILFRDFLIRDLLEVVLCIRNTEEYISQSSVEVGCCWKSRDFCCPAHSMDKHSI